MAETAPPPPPPAGFLVTMPAVPCNTVFQHTTWLSTGAAYRIRTRSEWPVTIAPDPAGVPERAEQTPAPCEAGMTSAHPEPVERWIERSLAAPYAAVPATAFPRASGIGIPNTLAAPALCADWTFSPEPEPVSRFVQPWFVDRPIAAGFAIVMPSVDAVAILADFAPPALRGAVALPAAEAVARRGSDGSHDRKGVISPFEKLLAPQAAEPLRGLGRPGLPHLRPELCTVSMPLAAAEPVASFVQPSRVEQTMLVAATFAPAFTLDAALEPLPEAALDSPAPCEQWMAAPPAEPVASFVQPSLVEQTILVAASFAPPFTLAAALEPLPEAAFDVPALCEQWMAAPPAEPLLSFLPYSSAAAVQRPIAHTAPALLAVVAGPYIPVATSLRAISQAEPVMAGVWPHVADTPVISIGSPNALRLPQIGHTAVSHQVLSMAAAKARLDAEPVEALLVASEAALPLTSAATLYAPEIAAISAVVPAPATARPFAAPAAEAVETLVTSSSANALVFATPVQLQAFQVARSEECGVPALQRPRVAVATAATAAAPAPTPGKELVLQPIATIQITAPEQRYEPPTPTIACPGLAAVEYHIQRTRSAAFARPEWKSPCFDPRPPQFRLQPVLDNLEDLLKPKAKPGAVFVMPPPSRRTRSAVMDNVLRVAAAVMIVTTFWFGGTALKNGRSKVVARQDASSFAAPNHTLTADSQTGNAKATKSKGPVNWVRKSIANRASVQLADDFQRGMKRWGADAAREYPAGWQRNADGYVHTGALAIFKPTVKFTDYRLEFFGQIENKSVGWAVRARDEKNYHAMKFTVVEAGLRPLIAMIHYNVVDGKAGRRIQTPLNVMVHNNRPMQVAVTVRGKILVTSIDGEEVDRFSDDGASGGVGFFSEAGERARLYWTKVTKNDDWLGHMCAFLSGESNATAELRPPAAPGQRPAPWSPAGGGNTALAAAWIGLPYLRRTETRRQRKPCNM